MIRLILKMMLGVTLSAVLLSSLALAHTTVKSSTLEDGGIYQTLPDVFELVFAQKVGLATFALKDGDGQTVSIEFQPPKSMETKFVIPLPELENGEYQMSWRAIAADGHVLKGGLSFTVR